MLLLKHWLVGTCSGRAYLTGAVNVTEATVKSLTGRATQKCRQKTEFSWSFVTFIIETAITEAGVGSPVLL